MIPKEEIVIVLGGISSEREISILSGEHIYDILNEAKVNVSKYYLNDDLDKFIRFLLNRNKRNTIIFNALHGFFGEDGKIQGLLDSLGVRYTHSGISASTIAMNKVIAKQLAKAVGVPVLKSEILNKELTLKGITIDFPFIVKPVDSGSSLNVFLVNNKKEFLAVQKKLSGLHHTFMIEEYVNGNELIVGIFNGDIVEVTSVALNSKTIFDYDAKYKVGMSKRRCPADINDNMNKQVKYYAQAVYQALELKDLARADFIYKDQEIFFLEINSHPGFTHNSLIVQQFECANIPILEVLFSLISQASYNK